MSNIKDIYKSISDMTISSVKARNIDKAKLAVTKTPIRILLPSTEAELSFFGLGNSQVAMWTIRDLCLFAPLVSGKGIEQYAEGMVDYISQYMAAVKSNRCADQNGSIENVAFQMGPVPWGDKDYWAIDVTLTVREVL